MMTVNSYLNNLSSFAVLNGNEEQAIKRSIRYLKEKLDQVEDIKEHFIFGSYKRGTILSRQMDEKSDIDYMVVFEGNDITPQAYLNWLKKFVNAYYVKSNIKQSHPIIKLDLNHITFEIVPALSSGFLSFGYKIPKQSGTNEWMSTYPNNFNKDLTEHNKKHNSQTKPLIRLMKYWNACNGYIFESFDLEQWIITQNFNNLWGKTPNLRDCFFNCITNIGIRNATQNELNRLTRAKNIIQNVYKYEDIQGNIFFANKEIHKLLPKPHGFEYWLKKK